MQMKFPGRHFFLSYFNILRVKPDQAKASRTNVQRWIK